MLNENIKEILLCLKTSINSGQSLTLLKYFFKIPKMLVYVFNIQH